MKRSDGNECILIRHFTYRPQSLRCYDGRPETCGRPDQANHLVPFKALEWARETFEGACQNFG